MPSAALRPCLEPRCPTLVRTGRCDQHGGPRTPWQAQPTSTPRLRGHANQRRRIALFQREPLCRTCRTQHRVTVATIADHVIPLAEGGPDTEANLQPLCSVCHAAKTRDESKRGSARAW